MRPHIVTERRGVMATEKTPLELDHQFRSLESDLHNRNRQLEGRVMELERKAARLEELRVKLDFEDRLLIIEQAVKDTLDLHKRVSALERLSADDEKRRA